MRCEINLKFMYWAWLIINAERISSTKIQNDICAIKSEYVKSRTRKSHLLCLFFMNFFECIEGALGNILNFSWCEYFGSVIVEGSHKTCRKDSCLYVKVFIECESPGKVWTHLLFCLNIVILINFNLSNRIFIRIKSY